MAMPRLFGRTRAIAGRSQKKYLEQPLFEKLFEEGGSELSVRRQLNQFLKSSKHVYKWEVDFTIKKLRDRKLYYPALKLSETMCKRGMNKTVPDQAIHLDLVAKTQGIPAAENYFIDLPETSKNLPTYGALLNCYCNELLVEEAEALMGKMKELNLGLTAMSYDSLMTMYTKIGQPERIPAIIQEMKASRVLLDCYTYNVWMRALAAVNDISGVERIIEEMKRDGRVAADWTTYSNLASIYVDAGLFEKAEIALKELEKKNAHQNFSAFQFLITLYGRTGNLLEVYRIWRSLRLAFHKTANISYLNMTQVLVNLKDLPGAEKCFREWESGCLNYDIRIVNVLIGAYVKEGLLEKAEQLKERALKRGVKPNIKTWEIFMGHYLRNGDVNLAIDCLTNAISTGKGDRQDWAPPHEVICAFMEHYEQQKDVDGAEGFIDILKKTVHDVGVEVFEPLIRTYAAAGRTSQAMQRRLKMENVEVSDASKKLLEAICVE
uniref:Pentatricopeptide repeat-containing protein At1g60770 n=2 Tax=Rhizophora mucronata TaxID=61149 RepID=A0A2P2J4Z0_RHIMU